MLCCSLKVSQLPIVWRYGETHPKHINSVYLLQKKAKWIINRSDYYKPTNRLFIKLHALIFYDLVDLCTALIMYKAQNNLFPGRIQRLFQRYV